MVPYKSFYWIKTNQTSEKASETEPESKSNVPIDPQFPFDLRRNEISKLPLIGLIHGRLGR